jgi:hypothetical protein
MSGKGKTRKRYIGPDGQPILCYLCGERQATTDDHVPPRGLFPNNAQFKGFKVPACKDCNNDVCVQPLERREAERLPMPYAWAINALQGPSRVDWLGQDGQGNLRREFAARAPDQRGEGKARLLSRPHPGCGS